MDKGGPLEQSGKPSEMQFVQGAGFRAIGKLLQTEAHAVSGVNCSDIPVTGGRWALVSHT